MLYNPGWEAKTSVLSLESLIAWLETQPAEKTYCYVDTGACLYHQYLSANGVPVWLVSGDYYREVPHGPPIPLPKNFWNIAAVEPHTFGAALERARKALA